VTSDGSSPSGTTENGQRFAGTVRRGCPVSEPPGWFCEKRRLSPEFSKHNSGDRRQPDFTNGRQSAQVRQAAERSGLNPDDCRFESCAGHLRTIRLGRQLADHLGLEPGMLWVRLPPESLTEQFVLVEQPGVLACLSRRRSWVQIPSGTLEMTTARYANRQSGQVQTLVSAGSTPACATGTRCVGWALASPSGCNPPASGMQVRAPIGMDAGLVAARRTGELWIRRRGAMLVLQRGFQSRQRGFDSRPRH
jgi:hypothetical protein